MAIVLSRPGIVLLSGLCVMLKRILLSCPDLLSLFLAMVVVLLFVGLSHMGCGSWCRVAPVLAVVSSVIPGAVFVLDW